MSARRSPDRAGVLPLAARNALVALLLDDLGTSPATGGAVGEALRMLREPPGASATEVGGAAEPARARAIDALLASALLATLPRRAVAEKSGAGSLVRRDAAWAEPARQRLHAYAAALARAPRGLDLVDRLAQARVLFGLGLFFEVHEVLEPPWRSAAGDERRVLQGLIQAAVAWHHGTAGNESGARRLAAEASVKLLDAPERWNGFPLGELRACLASFAEWLEAGTARPAPALPWAEDASR